MQITLKTLLLIVLYFSACSLVFVSSNVTIGWLIVVATSLWMAFAAWSAFRHQNRFWLGFSIFGAATLSIVLGFCVQTPPNSRNISVVNAEKFRAGIQKLAWCGREMPEVDSMAYIPYADVHDLMSSSSIGNQGIDHIPHFLNVMRLFACLVSVFMAFLGGLLVNLLLRSQTKEAMIDSETSGC